MSTNICSTPCKSCGNTWFSKDILKSDETKTVVSCNNCSTEKEMKKRPMKTLIIVRSWNRKLGLFSLPDEKHTCLKPFNRITQSRLKEIYELQQAEDLLLEFEKIDRTTDDRDGDEMIGTQVFKNVETIWNEKKQKYVEKETYEII